MFLAEAYRSFSVPLFRRTALGALRLALSRLHEVPSERRSSFYCGQLGVLSVGFDVARVLNDAEAETYVAQLAAEYANEASEAGGLDVICGSASAIAALLRLAHCGVGGALALAVRHGNRLLERALREDHRFAWPPDLPPTSGISAIPLTGLAHGASGFALALLELFSVTNDRRYLEAARGAFCYEDGYFDSGARNWQDIRPPLLGREPSFRPTFGAAWCHGAPGIGLARMRAVRLDPDGKSLHEAKFCDALETTVQVAKQALTTRLGEVGLCHGAAGLGEILLTAFDCMGSAQYRTVARQVASRIAEDPRLVNHGASSVFASDPGLMLGASGVGLFLLHATGRMRGASVLLNASDHEVSGRSPLENA